MTTDDAKTYLAKREIPRLFESLMTGLMYHRPGDHIKYLIDCLQKVHDKGQQDITWSSFVDIRRSKTPLPPIDKRRPSSKGSRPSSRTRTPNKDDEWISKGFENLESRESTPTFDGRYTQFENSDQSVSNVLNLERNEESSPRDLTASEPLPAIPTVQKVDLPECPIVVVIGAPGSDKAAHVEKLLKRYPGWEHVNMGNLIKEEISQRGEGHTKWRMIRDLFSKGDAVPEDVIVEVLVDRLKQCSKAKGIVINGFPRSMMQLGDFDKVVGRLDCVFMLDCDEQLALDKLLRRGKETGNPEDSLSSIAARLNYFKSNTLACAKHIDDQGKLIVIDGDQGTERVEFDLGKAFDNLFLSKYGSQPLATEEPPKSAGPPPPAPTYKGKYESETDEQDGEEMPLFEGAPPEPPVIDVSDDGRKPDLPQCPIVFVAGGPGSGKGTQCEKIVQRYPNFVHLSMGDILPEEISTKGTADEKWTMISQLLSKGEMAPEEEIVDLIKENLKKHSSAKAFLIEGFPRNKEQVEAFNKHIGGLNFVLLFDCEEYYMQNRLIKRGKESGRIDDNISAIAKKLHYYKHNTLPVLKYYDDLGKLVCLDADRDMEEMFYDISKLLDFAFFADDSGEKLKLKEIETTKDSKSSPQTKQHWYQNFYGSPSPTSEEQKTSHGGLDDNGAATRIQAGYLGYKVRKESKASPQSSPDKKTVGKEQSEQSEQTSDTEAELDPATQQAATRIQAGYRGYKARSEVKARREEAQRQDEAASRIQAGFRGFKVRAEMNDKKNQVKREESPDLEAQDTQEASSRIQAGYHGYKTRSEFKARRENQQREESPDLEAQDTQEASSRIQAGYHGYKTRSEFKARRENQQRGESPEVKDTQEASSRIQAGYRGYKTRSEFKARRENQQETKQPTPEPVQEEVVEATITPQAGTTTGDDIANPDYSEKLDEVAKQEETSS